MYVARLWFFKRSGCPVDFAPQLGYPYGSFIFWSSACSKVLRFESLSGKQYRTFMRKL